jgi:hypothetical protein
MIADLSKFLQDHPAMYTNAADFEPDGTFYSLIAYQDRLYTVEPNHGQVFSITPSGDVREVIDISEAEAHIVPTSIAAKDDNFYVGNLGLFPITPDASKILTISTGQGGGFVPGLDVHQEMQKLRVAGSRAGFATVVAVDNVWLLFCGGLGFPTPGPGPSPAVQCRRSKEPAALAQPAVGVVVDRLDGVAILAGRLFALLAG